MCHLLALVFFSQPAGSTGKASRRLQPTPPTSFSSSDFAVSGRADSVAPAALDIVCDRVPRKQQLGHR